MKFKINDLVKILVEIPGEAVSPGDVGTVVEVFDVPREAYEVEFCDREGRTVAQLAVLPSQIALP